MKKDYDVLIIGAGPAGITAAIYLKRANLNCAIIEKEAPGGQLNKSSEIENYPGYTKISGPDLATKFYEQINNLNIKQIFSEVTNIEIKDNKKILTLKNGEQLGLFIEGTRSKTDDFLRPKTGCAMIAYKTGATIIPVCITGANEHKLKILKKNVISIGEPIKVNQLNVKEGTGKEFRDTSRFIMESIKELRPNFNE